MKKVLLTLIAGSVLATSVYALLPTLFPDTVPLPRIPVQTGTIGNIISKILGTADLGNYASDGTISETAHLSGATATGYLHLTPDCPPTQVYGGIDTAGKRICRSQTLLLTQVGRIMNRSGTVMVYHASGSSTLVSSLPYIIMN